MPYSVSIFDRMRAQSQEPEAEGVLAVPDVVPAMKPPAKTPSSIMIPDEVEPGVYSVMGRPMKRDEIAAYEGGNDLLSIVDRSKQGRRGFGEAITDIGWSDAPLIGDVVGVALPIRKMFQIPGILRRMEAGERVDPQELIDLQLYLADTERKSQASMGGKAGEIIRAMPGFAAPFFAASFIMPQFAVPAAMAGAGATAARGAMRKAAEFMIGKKATNMAAKLAAETMVGRSAERMVRAAVPQLPRMLLGGAAMAVADTAVNALVNTAANDMHPLESRGSIERMIGAEIEGTDLTPGQARLLALGDNAIEYISEFAGPALASPLIGEAFGAAKLLTRGVQRGLRGTPEILEAGASAAERAQGTAFRNLYDKFTGGAEKVNKWLTEKAKQAPPAAGDTFAMATGRWMARQMVENDITPVQAWNQLRRAGYDGWLEEMGEERIGGFMKGFLGISGDDDGGLKNALAEAMPASMDDAMAEAIAFAVPLAVPRIINTAQMSTWLGGPGMGQVRQHLENVISAAGKSKNIIETYDGKVIEAVPARAADTLAPEGQPTKDQVSIDVGADSNAYLASLRNQIGNARPNWLQRMLYWGLEGVNALATGDYSFAGTSRRLLGQFGISDLPAIANQVRDGALANMTEEERAKPEAQAEADKAARLYVRQALQWSRESVALESDHMAAALEKAKALLPESDAEPTVDELVKVAQQAGLVQYVDIGDKRQLVMVTDVPEGTPEATERQTKLAGLMAETLRAAGLQSNNQISLDKMQAATSGRGINKADALARIPHRAFTVEDLEDVARNPRTAAGLALAAAANIWVTTKQGFNRTQQYARDLAAAVKLASDRKVLETKAGAKFLLIPDATNPGVVKAMPMDRSSEPDWAVANAINEGMATEDSLRQEHGAESISARGPDAVRLMAPTSLVTKDPVLAVSWADASYGWNQALTDQYRNPDTSKETKINIENKAKDLLKSIGFKAENGVWSFTPAGFNDESVIHIAAGMHRYNVGEELIEQTGTQLALARGMSLADVLPQAARYREEVANMIRDRKDPKDTALLEWLGSAEGFREFSAKALAATVLGANLSTLKLPYATEMATKYAADMRRLPTFGAFLAEMNALVFAQKGAQPANIAAMFYNHFGNLDAGAGYMDEVKADIVTKPGEDKSTAKPGKAKKPVAKQEEPAKETPATGDVVAEAPAAAQQPRELMTPAEFDADLVARSEAAKAEAGPGTLGALVENERSLLRDALEARRPVNAALLDRYNAGDRPLAVPAGYVLEGDRYVFNEKPVTTTPVVTPQVTTPAVTTPVTEAPTDMAPLVTSVESDMSRLEQGMGGEEEAGNTPPVVDIALLPVFGSFSGEDEGGEEEAVQLVDKPVVSDLPEKEVIADEEEGEDTTGGMELQSSIVQDLKRDPRKWSAVRARVVMEIGGDPRNREKVELISNAARTFYKEPAFTTEFVVAMDQMLTAPKPAAVALTPATITDLVPDKDADSGTSDAAGLDDSGDEAKGANQESGDKERTRDIEALYDGAARMVQDMIANAVSGPPVQHLIETLSFVDHPEVAEAAKGAKAFEAFVTARFAALKPEAASVPDTIAVQTLLGEPVKAMTPYLKAARAQAEWAVWKALAAVGYKAFYGLYRRYSHSPLMLGVSYKAGMDLQGRYTSAAASQAATYPAKRIRRDMGAKLERVFTQRPAEALQELWKVLTALRKTIQSKGADASTLDALKPVLTSILGHAEFWQHTLVPETLKASDGKILDYLNFALLDLIGAVSAVMKNRDRAAGLVRGVIDGTKEDADKGYQRSALNSLVDAAEHARPAMMARTPEGKAVSMYGLPSPIDKALRENGLRRVEILGVTGDKVSRNKNKQREAEETGVPATEPFALDGKRLNTEKLIALAKHDFTHVQKINAAGWTLPILVGEKAQPAGVWIPREKFESFGITEGMNADQAFDAAIGAVHEKVFGGAALQWGNDLLKRIVPNLTKGNLLVPGFIPVGKDGKVSMLVLTSGKTGKEWDGAIYVSQNMWAPMNKARFGASATFDTSYNLKGHTVNTEAGDQYKGDWTPANTMPKQPGKVKSTAELITEQAGIEDLIAVTDQGVAKSIGSEKTPWSKTIDGVVYSGYVVRFNPHEDLRETTDLEDTTRVTLKRMPAPTPVNIMAADADGKAMRQLGTAFGVFYNAIAPKLAPDPKRLSESLERMDMTHEAAYVKAGGVTTGYGVNSRITPIEAARMAREFTFMTPAIRAVDSPGDANDPYLAPLTEVTMDDGQVVLRAAMVRANIQGARYGERVRTRFHNDPAAAATARNVYEAMVSTIDNHELRTAAGLAGAALAKGQVPRRQYILAILEAWHTPDTQALATQVLNYLMVDVNGNPAENSDYSDLWIAADGSSDQTALMDVLDPKNPVDDTHYLLGNLILSNHIPAMTMQNHPFMRLSERANDNKNQNVVVMHPELAQDINLDYDGDTEKLMKFLQSAEAHAVLGNEVIATAVDVTRRMSKSHREAPVSPEFADDIVVTAHGRKQKLSEALKAEHVQLKGGVPRTAAQMTKVTDALVYCGGAIRGACVKTGRDHNIMAALGGHWNNNVSLTLNERSYTFDREPGHSFDSDSLAAQAWMNLVEAVITGIKEPGRPMYLGLRKELLGILRTMMSGQQFENMDQIKSLLTDWAAWVHESPLAKILIQKQSAWEDKITLYDRGEVEAARLKWNDDHEGGIQITRTDDMWIVQELARQTGMSEELAAGKAYPFILLDGLNIQYASLARGVNAVTWGKVPDAAQASGFAAFTRSLEELRFGGYNSSPLGLLVDSAAIIQHPWVNAANKLHDLIAPLYATSPFFTPAGQALVRKMGILPRVRIDNLRTAFSKLGMLSALARDIDIPLAVKLGTPKPDTGLNNMNTRRFETGRIITALVDAQRSAARQDPVLSELASAIGNNAFLSNLLRISKTGRVEISDRAPVDQTLSPQDRMASDAAFNALGQLGQVEAAGYTLTGPQIQAVLMLHIVDAYPEKSGTRSGNYFELIPAAYTAMLSRRVLEDMQDPRFFEGVSDPGNKAYPYPVLKDLSWRPEATWMLPYRWLTGTKAKVTPRETGPGPARAHAPVTGSSTLPPATPGSRDVKAAKSDMQMSYRMPAGTHTGPAGDTTTWDAINDGWRTASTRHWAMEYQPGNRFDFVNPQGRAVKIEVEGMTPQIGAMVRQRVRDAKEDEAAATDAVLRDMAVREGWTFEQFKKFYVEGKTVNKHSRQLLFRKFVAEEEAPAATSFVTEETKLFADVRKEIKSAAVTQAIDELEQAEVSGDLLGSGSEVSLVDPAMWLTRESDWITSKPAEVVYRKYRDTLGPLIRLGIERMDAQDYGGNQFVSLSATALLGALPRSHVDALAGKAPVETEAQIAERQRAAGQLDLFSPGAVNAPEAQAPSPAVNVWFGSGENAILSNLAPREFTFDGRMYWSVEHAYQSLKSGSFDQATYDKYARAAGVKIPGTKGTKTENKWNIQLMEMLLRESFRQNFEAAKALKATEGSRITHTQDAGIWRIEFPQLLEKIRAEYAGTTFEEAQAPQAAAQPQAPTGAPEARAPTLRFVQDPASIPGVAAGPGSKTGTGADKAMRDAVQAARVKAFVGEIQPGRLNNSSTGTSALLIAGLTSENVKVSGTSHVVIPAGAQFANAERRFAPGEAVAMVAGNSRTRLTEPSKEALRKLAAAGFEFVVGSMPNHTDTDAVEFLIDLGAPVTIHSWKPQNATDRLSPRVRAALAAKEAQAPVTPAADVIDTAIPDALAKLQRDGTVVVNKAAVQADYEAGFPYLSGASDMRGSKQKAVVFARVDLAKFKAVLGSAARYEAFIIEHERAHKALGHLDGRYPKDWMDERAILMERQANAVALQKLGISVESIRRTPAQEASMPSVMMAPAQFAANESLIQERAALQKRIANFEKSVSHYRIAHGGELPPRQWYAKLNRDELALKAIEAKLRGEAAAPAEQALLGIEFTMPISEIRSRVQKATDAQLTKLALNSMQYPTVAQGVDEERRARHMAASVRAGRITAQEGHDNLRNGEPWVLQRYQALLASGAPQIEGTGASILSDTAALAAAAALAIAPLQRAEAGAPPRQVQVDEPQLRTEVPMPPTIRETEAMKSRVFTGVTGHPLIGAGHDMSADDAQGKAAFEAATGVKWLDARSGKATLTPAQMEALLVSDWNIHTAKARRMFNNFDQYPVGVQTAVVDMLYIGIKAPKFFDAIKRQDWATAIKEIGVANDDYMKRREGLKKTRAEAPTVWRYQDVINALRQAMQPRREVSMAPLAPGASETQASVIPTTWGNVVSRAAYRKFPGDSRQARIGRSEFNKSYKDHVLFIRDPDTSDVARERTIKYLEQREPGLASDVRKLMTTDPIKPRTAKQQVADATHNPADVGPEEQAEVKPRMDRLNTAIDIAGVPRALVNRPSESRKPTPQTAVTQAQTPELAGRAAVERYLESKYPPGSKIPNGERSVMINAVNNAVRHAPVDNQRGFENHLASRSPRLNFAIEGDLIAWSRQNLLPAQGTQFSLVQSSLVNADEWFARAMMKTMPTGRSAMQERLIRERAWMTSQLGRMSNFINYWNGYLGVTEQGLQGDGDIMKMIVEEMPAGNLKEGLSPTEKVMTRRPVRTFGGWRTSGQKFDADERKTMQLWMNAVDKYREEGDQSRVFTAVPVDLENEDTILAKLLPPNLLAALQTARNAAKEKAANTGMLSDANRDQAYWSALRESGWAATQLVDGRHTKPEWTIPVTAIEAEFHRSARNKLIEAGRDKDVLTMKAFSELLAAEYDYYQAEIDRQRPQMLFTEDNGYLPYQELYIPHRYGQGFLGSEAIEVRAELKRSLDKVRKEKREVYEGVLDVSRTKQGQPRPLTDVTERMWRYLADLKGIPYTSPNAIITEIQAGQLKDRYGLVPGMTYADIARVVHNEVENRLTQRALTQEPLDTPFTGVPNIDDPLALLAYLKKGMTKFKDREYSKHVMQRQFTNYLDAYTKAGIRPGDFGATKVMHDYVGNILGVTYRKYLLNQFAVMQDTDGAPLMILDPTQESSEEQKSIFADDVLETHSEILSKYFEIPLDMKLPVRERLHKLVEQSQIRQGRGRSMYERVDSPYPSIQDFFARKEVTAEANVLDMLVGGEAAGILKHVIGERYEDAWGIMNGLAHFNQFMKLIALQFSGFFGMSAVESVVAAQAGLASNLKGVFDLGEVGPVNQRRMAKANHEYSRELLRVMQAAGAQVSQSVHTFGLDAGMLEADIAKIVDWTSAHMGTAIGRRVNSFLHLPMANSEIMFGTIFNTAKMWMAARFLERSRKYARDNNIEFDPVQALRPWANTIDMSLGDMNPDKQSFKTPGFRQFFELTMFSEPWTLAAWSIAGGGLLSQGILKNYVEPHELKFIAKNWAGMAIGVLWLIPMLTQFAIYLGLGDPDKDRPFIWDNETNRKFHIDITPLLRKAPWLMGGTPYEGEPTGERRGYVRWGKQSYEVLNGWMVDARKTAMGKMSQIARLAFELVTGTSPGSEWDLGFKNQGLTGLILDKDNEFKGSVIGTIANKFMPFSILAWARNPNAGTLNLIAPVSKGTSYHVATSAYYQILKTWANQDTYAKLYTNPQLRSNLESLGADILDAAQRNGYEPKEVLKAARGAVFKELYSEFYRALDKQDNEAIERASRKIMRVNGSIDGLLRSVRNRDRMYGEAGPRTPEQLAAITAAFERP